MSAGEKLNRETVEAVLGQIAEQAETPLVIIAFDLEGDGAVAAWTRNTDCRLEAWLARNAFTRIAVAIDLIGQICEACGFDPEGWSGASLREVAERILETDDDDPLEEAA